jgi:hypothetical protein
MERNNEIANLILKRMELRREIIARLREEIEQRLKEIEMQSEEIRRESEEVYRLCGADNGKN